VFYNMKTIFKIIFAAFGLLGSVAVPNMAWGQAQTIPCATITISGNTTICGNSTLTATACTQSASSNPTSDPCPFTYRWSHTPTNSSAIGDGATTITQAAGTTVTYTVTATQVLPSTCTATKTITVTRRPAINLTVTGNTTSCGSTILTAASTAAGCTYLWSNGQSTAAVTLTTSGIYTVTVSNATGCATATRSVTINPLPTATLSVSNTVCGASTITATISSNVIISNDPNTNGFNWIDGLSDGVLTRVVTTSGIYGVEVTTPQGCYASFSQAVNVNPLPMVTIATTGTLPSATFTAAATPTNATLLWNTSATTAQINVATHGVYTVTATIPASGCTATKTAYIETVACTSQAGYTVVGKTGEDKTISSLIGTGSGYLLSPNWWNVNQYRIPQDQATFKWLIRGNLIYDLADMTMPNIDFKMCEDASIQVGKYNGTVPVASWVQLGGGFYEADKIQGIDKMWKGITVLPTSGLDFISDGSSLATTTGRTATISDAITAITVKHGGKIHVYSIVNGGIYPNSRVKLENNQTAIYFEPRGAQTPLSTGGVVSTTDITITRPLLAPYNTQFGHTGIVANDCTLAISEEVETRLTTFSKLKYGIKANNSTLTLRHTATFKDITDWNNPIATTSDATAIWLENGSTWANSTSSGIAKVSIYGADRGVYLNNASATFNNIAIGLNTANNRSTLTGIEAINSTNKTVLINGGTITTQGTGIKFNNNTIGSYTVESAIVTAGTAANVSGNHGISIAHNSNIEAPTYTIHNSVIKMTNGAAAVYLSGVNATSTIKDCHISLDNVGKISTGSAVGLKRYALYLTATSGVNIQHNNVKGNGAYTDGTGAIVQPNTAIYGFNSNASTLICNTTDNMATGIGLVGAQTGTTLQTNHIKNHSTGLLYGSTVANLPAQATGAANLFEGTYQKSAWNQTIASLGQPNVQGQLYFNTTARPQTLPPTNTQFIGTGTGIQANWLSPTLDAQPYCAPLALSANTDIATQYAIAIGDVETVEFATEMQWEMQKELYQKLSAEPALLVGNSDLQAFKDSLDQTAIADIIDIKTQANASLKPSEALNLQLNSLKSQLENIQMQLETAAAANDDAAVATWKQLYSTTSDALMVLEETADAQVKAAADNLAALNASMQAVEVQEINQKAVNHLYFTKFAKGEVPARANDIALLEYIAAQCPYTGGNAVFEARGLLALLNKEGVYDDPTTCAAQGINLRKAPVKVNTAKQVSNVVRIMPNPASTSVRLDIPSELIGTTYHIVDATGKLVQSNTINAMQQNIDIQNISAGLYYIKILGAAYEVQPIKLVVIK
jgi:hypothetical protein